MRFEEGRCVYLKPRRLIAGLRINSAENVKKATNEQATRVNAIDGIGMAVEVLVEALRIVRVARVRIERGESAGRGAVVASAVVTQPVLVDRLARVADRRDVAVAGSKPISSPNAS